jgi:cold-inducible RNA-binding protein
LKNIFVGNLSFNTGEDELRQMFEQYGQVDRVAIMTDRDTGRSRGFGFVEMTNDEDGEKAIAALNGSQLGGRTLNVNEARPKTERGGGGGGGGRSGGGGRGRDRGDRGGRGGGGGRWLSHRSVRFSKEAPSMHPFGEVCFATQRRRTLVIWYEIPPRDCIAATRPSM